MSMFSDRALSQKPEPIPEICLGSENLVGRTIASPVGPLRLVASQSGLVAVLWHDDRPGRVPLGAVDDGRSDHLDLAQEQLDAYFAGHRRSFDVPLDLRGTFFQRAVWAQLAAIPFGETRSYGAIAAAIGQPSASRAVGAANGRNPVSIIVPCHRVIGAAGSLTGFAGGLEAKQYLLALEGHETRRLL